MVRNKRESPAVCGGGVMTTTGRWEDNEWQKGFWFLFTWRHTRLQRSRGLCAAPCAHALALIDCQCPLFYSQSGPSPSLKGNASKTVWSSWRGGKGSRLCLNNQRKLICPMSYKELWKSSCLFLYLNDDPVYPKKENTGRTEESLAFKKFRQRS